MENRCRSEVLFLVLLISNLDIQISLNLEDWAPAIKETSRNPNALLHWLNNTGSSFYRPWKCADSVSTLWIIWMFFLGPDRYYSGNADIAFSELYINSVIIVRLDSQSQLTEVVLLRLWRSTLIFEALFAALGMMRVSFLVSATRKTLVK